MPDKARHMLLGHRTKAVRWTSLVRAALSGLAGNAQGSLEKDPSKGEDINKGLGKLRKDKYGKGGLGKKVKQEK